MRWEAVAAVAELLGAVGVCVSLVFLAFQVRANTRTLRARASYDASLSWSENNERVALTLFQTDGERNVAEEGLRLWSADSTPDEFSPQDFVPHALLLRGLFQRMEAQFWLVRHGLLEETQWENKAQWFAGGIQLPVIAAWWESELAIGTFSAEFLSALAKLTPKADLAGTAGVAMPGVKRSTT